MARIAELEENKCAMAFELKESQEALSEARGQVAWLQSQLSEQTHLAEVLRNQIISLGAEPEELVLEEEEEEAKAEEEAVGDDPDPPMARPSKAPRLM